MRKQLQDNTMCIHEAMSNVQTLTKFVKDYWENGFEKVLDSARTIVFYLGIDQVFVEKNNKRRIKKYILTRVVMVHRNGYMKFHL